MIKTAKENFNDMLNLKTALDILASFSFCGYKHMDSKAYELFLKDVDNFNEDFMTVVNSTIKSYEAES